MWLVLIGAFLAASAGSHFVFFFSSQYRVGAWLGALILFACFYRFLANPDRQKRPADPHWAGRMRRLSLFSFGAAMAAGITVLAPFGWLLAATQTLGDTRTSVPARVLLVSDFHRGRGCDQSGVLAFEGRVASICAEGRGKLPLRANQSVLLSGKQSAFGFLVADVSAP